MKNPTPVLWLVAGLLIGASSTSVAKVPPQQTPASRLQVTVAHGGAYGGGLRSEAYFVKDPKSGGCWLVLQFAREQTSAAPAPKEACE